MVTRRFSTCCVPALLLCVACHAEPDDEPHDAGSGGGEGTWSGGQDDGQSGSGDGGDGGGEDGGSDGGGDDGTDPGGGDDDGTTGDADPDGELPDLDPPAGESSGGTGGGASDGAMRSTPDDVFYYVIADGSSGPHPLLIVYPGLEGGETMTNNFRMAVPHYGMEHWTIAVLEGWFYANDGNAGASVLDDMRSLYDIDNDRTYLLSESAGTPGGLLLGLTLRQSYFAGFWANDVSLSGSPPTPALSADDLRFRPWGNAGPGGAYQLAQSIVDGMEAAGYRLTDPAPYDGPGAGSHGSNDQFQNAIQWFFDKSRL